MRGVEQLRRDLLTGFFDEAGAQVHELFYFSAFIPVFLGFFWLVVSFAEGMFAVTNDFSNHVYRFCHNWHFLS
jgi:TM2 domain-containing membrane protein YozV